MKKLSHLHEEFLDSVRRPMSFGRLPILPKGVDVPILPVNKWIEKDGFLRKKYDFMSKELRNEFVNGLFDHEVTAGHHAKIVIDEDCVIISLQTKNIEKITELDKEYARHSDTLYKDVVYKVPEKFDKT